MSKEIREKFKNCQTKMRELHRILKIDEVRAKKDQLQKLSQAEDFWLDAKKAQNTIKELNESKNLIGVWDQFGKDLADVEAILELLPQGENEELEKEATEKIAAVEKGLEGLEFRRMLSGEHDRADAILFINAGAGGTEACDWAEMLLRMYRRWADRKGFKNQVIDFTPGDGAGFRSVVITVEGEYSYGYLQAEIGVHRLVRISPFDANKRRHTSFASVFVLPDIEKDIKIEIKEDDLRIDTFRAGGAGGQKVNKTESAVRITHIPSGIVVACQNERSQHQNRALAMKVLKARLYELELEKRQKEKDEIEKSKKKIEWGSQIRSYVMQPYRLVKDHRTNLEAGNVDAVMDGDIDPFIQKFLMENQ